MHAFRAAVVLATSTGMLIVSNGAVARGRDLPARRGGHGHEWLLSRGQLPISVDRMIGVKLDDHRVMWLGQTTANPADNRRTFIYDVRTRTFRETAPVPFAKTATDRPDDSFALLSLAAVGVLSDGSVVIAGGQVTDRADRNAETVLSYRYDPRRDRWTRTGDLPEPQEWVGTATLLLRDGRLLAAGGRGPSAIVSGVPSVRAFVFDPRRSAMVAEIDPDTGLPTGRRTRVTGTWGYTRTVGGAESTMSEPHYFGNEVLLHDGRVLVAGGHTLWKLDTDDTSVLATHTEFFDPATGTWTQGPPLPTIAGEDDRISGSHGGRTNGACFAGLSNDKVVIAGGATQTDGAGYGSTLVGRQSIVVMTPAANPRNSRYQVSPKSIPSGTQFGGLYGDGGRNQLPCYAISRDRVLITGGQTNVGEDLYDGYVFEPRDRTLRRGPEMAHGTAKWAAVFPEFGYPPEYQAVPISTREVAMHSSLLVFPGDVLVHGGGYDNLEVDFVGSRQVEQLNGV